MSDDDPEPIRLMREHGFDEAYIEKARKYLPHRWEYKYDGNPRELAAGLTYYVAFDDFTQSEIADRFGWSDGNSVSKAYRWLRYVHGLPGDQPDLPPGELDLTLCPDCGGLLRTDDTGSWYCANCETRWLGEPK